MVSVFPDLLAFSFLAPFILRVFLGFYFLYFGAKILKTSESVFSGVRTEHVLGGISLIGGTFVLIGLFTQPAAGVLALISLYETKKPEHRVLYLLLFSMALSLLFSGAGFFAFDLPL